MFIGVLILLSQAWFGKFIMSYSELVSKFGEISFHKYASEGIPHPVFYVDIFTKLRMVKATRMSSRRARK